MDRNPPVTIIRHVQPLRELYEKNQNNTTNADQGEPAIGNHYKVLYTRGAQLLPAFAVYIQTFQYFGKYSYRPPHPEILSHPYSTPLKSKTSPLHHEYPPSHDDRVVSLC